MKAAWLALVVTACTTSSTVVETRVETVADTSRVVTREIQEESIDPYLIYQPWKDIPRVKMARDLKDLTVQDWTSGDTSRITKDGPVIGFRVQLFATKDYYEAVDKRDEASERFDAVVHMDFDPPYYKIRVGDFVRRDEAEQTRVAARERGYADAWIVRTLIATDR